MLLTCSRYSEIALNATVRCCIHVNSVLLRVLLSRSCVMFVIKRCVSPASVCSACVP